MDAGLEPKHCGFKTMHSTPDEHIGIANEKPIVSWHLGLRERALCALMSGTCMVQRLVAFSTSSMMLTMLTGQWLFPVESLDAGQGPMPKCNSLNVSKSKRSQNNMVQVFTLDGLP